MEKQLMIYGAYGYTGALITEQAIAKGLQPILAGRDGVKTKTIAEKYQLPYHVFDLENSTELEKILNDVDILMNAAGPYSKTAKPMVNACLATKTHYLDVTGEIAVFEWIAAKDKEAKEKGITLLPGCGFDVVPSDCLAAMLKDEMPDATHLSLAFKGVGSFSRGTALTMLENIHKGGIIRENGKLKAVPAAYKTNEVFLKGKKRQVVSIPWGDVSTAFYSTDIPNIIVYMATNPSMLRGMKFTRYGGWLLSLPFINKMLEKKVRTSVQGPNTRERQTEKSYLWGKVSNENGEQKELYLETPEGYQLTALTSVWIMQALIEGNVKPGFLTPSKAFGKEMILQIANTKVTSL